MSTEKKGDSSISEKDSVTIDTRSSLRESIATNRTSEKRNSIVHTRRKSSYIVPDFVPVAQPRSDSPAAVPQPTRVDSSTSSEDFGTSNKLAPSAVSPGSLGILSPFPNHTQEEAIIHGEEEYLERVSIGSSRYANTTFFRAWGELMRSETPYTFGKDKSFWDKALDASLPQVHSRQEALELDISSTVLSISMLETNAKTHHFNQLLLHVITQLRRMRANAYGSDWSRSAHNSLFALRTVLKHVITTQSSKEIETLFEGDRERAPESDTASDKPNSSASEFPSGQRRRSSIKASTEDIDPSVLADKRLRGLVLIEELLQVIIYANTKSIINYQFYVETLNILLVLFSGQTNDSLSTPSLFENSSPQLRFGNSYFLSFAISSLCHFGKGVSLRLLSNVIQQQPTPAFAGGLIYSAYSAFFAAPDDVSKASPLADKSNLILLVLASQASPANSLSMSNMYRTVLQTLEDETTTSSKKLTQSSSILEEEDGPNEKLGFPFRALFDTCVKFFHKEEISLLLYTLMTQNSHFRVYTLSRTDPEVLLLPLLKGIYDCAIKKTDYSRSYILLVILLILSQDEVYTANIHKVKLSSPPTWFTERNIRSISLGTFLFVVMLKIVQTNLSARRDLFYHSTALAILANMSMCVVAMPGVVSQKFVSLLEKVIRRYIILSKEIGHNDSFDQILHVDLTTASPTDPDSEQRASIPHASSNLTALASEFAIYSDILALFLEILNAILSNNLKENPQLVYTLLHKQDIVSPLRIRAGSQVARFKDLVVNIDSVIGYFRGRMDEEIRSLASGTGGESSSTSVDAILNVIERASRTWTNAKLTSCPAPRFTYEEESQYEFFFLPYVWSLVFRHSLIYWDEFNARIIQEFNVDFANDIDFSVPT